MRQAGYFFIPVTSSELTCHLCASTVKEGEVVETSELKAIRESVLRVRMSDWLQLPNEASWLDMTLKAYSQVLKSLWKDGIDLADIIARSNWIVDQADIRGWLHCMERENGDYLVKIGRGNHLLLWLLPPANSSKEISNAYSKWVEEKILLSIKEQFPDLYTWLVDWFSERVKEAADKDYDLEKLI